MTMEFRKAIFASEDGTLIDMEVKHPIHGWVPFTASASGVEEADRELFRKAKLGVVAAYKPPVLITSYSIAKTTPWLRMTDEEAEIMEAELNASTSKERQMYAAATYLYSGDPLWVTLKQKLTSAFGANRADELLARE